MNAKQLQHQLTLYANRIRTHVDFHMKQNGDTEETSQRICLLNAVNNLEYCINGIIDDDLKN
jgi:hypothetical protein